MPVGAIIGGVASIGGALLSSSAQKKAANTAAAAADRTAEMNNALARDIYGQNKQTLSPYVQSGYLASNAINELLGLTQPGQAPVGQPQPQPQQSFAPQNVNALTGQAFRPREDLAYIAGPEKTGIGMMGRAVGNQQYGIPMPAAQAQSQMPMQATGQPSARSAFDNYLNSAGYQFRLGEGNKQINQGYAARSALQSGAAMKALQSYGQNMASDEFGKYLGYLSNQQGVGLSGASAQAGVGQNYVNNVTANNNSAGSAAANAALMKGAATSNMWGGIAQGIGNIFGSSYGR